MTKPITVNSIKEKQETASERFVSNEREKLSDWREKRGRDDGIWTGIAMSGGGIRSSTFCLGVTQALANKDLLKHVDYISTVSGGGFNGSSLQWWWTGNHNISNSDEIPKTFFEKVKAFFLSLIGQELQTAKTDKIENVSGLGPTDFPYGTQHPDPSRRENEDSLGQTNVLNFLRAHGRYLTPGNGINFWSGIGVLVRSILLNLLVWIPIAAFIFVLLTLDKWRDWLGPRLEELPNKGSPLPETLIGRGWGNGFEPGLQEAILLPPAFAVVIWIGYLILAVYFIGSLFFSFQTSGATEDSSKPWDFGRKFRYFLTSAVLIALGYYIFFKWTPELLAAKKFSEVVVWILNTVAIILAFMGISIFMAWLIAVLGVNDMGDAYRLRRNFEKIVGKFFRWFLIILGLGFVPVIFTYTFTLSSSPGIAGLFSVAAGVAAALWGHYQTFKKISAGLASKILLPLGAALFLLGLVVLGYEISMILKDPELVVASYDGKLLVVESPLSQGAYDLIRYLLLTLIGLALIGLVIVNTNQISLNRFYRDRLTEAYMPNVSAINSGKMQRSPVAERMQMKDFWRPENMVPYPIVNTNVVLVNEEDYKYRVRGGDNYVLTPYFCGSSATDWHPTNSASSGHITLASGMAASGAAANPNAGYVGTGPTRGRLLSIVMMLLNIRLGYWIPHPAKERRTRPTHLMPGGIYAVTKHGFQADSSFLELSDGGHFDNLGIYELIRRKCKLIIVIDGEADLGASYSALISVQRRIEEDFDATIIFEKGSGPELMVANEDMAYPSGAKKAKRPYFLASVRYNDGTVGRVIYMKATMIEELSFKSLGYKGAHPDFPHETTADQFFGPEQFEAYRELGYCTGMEMMSGLNLKERDFKYVPTMSKLDSLLKDT